MRPSRHANGAEETSSGALAAARRQLEEHLHLVRGSVGVMVSTIAASITGWLFWVIATHHWPTSQIGVSTSLVAALTSIALIAGQPIATTMLLRLPRSSGRLGLLAVGTSAAVGIALCECVVAIFVLPASVGVVRTPGLAALFVIGSAAAAAGVVVDASSIAIRKPGLMVARNGMHGGGKLLLLAAIAIPAGLVTAPFVVIGVWAAMSVGSTLWEWRRWHDAARAASDEALGGTRDLRAGFEELRVGFGVQVLGTLGGSLPPLLLPIVVVGVLGSVSAGWFSITWLVGGLCFLISPAVCQALLAEGSLLPAQLDSKTRAAAVLSSGLLIVPVILYLTAGRIVLDIFGPSYGAHGTVLLRILAISAIPDLITNVAVARYRVQGRLVAAAAINVVIAIVAVGGTTWSLRAHGINAAGWSWALAETAGCVVLLGLLVLDRACRRVADGTGVPA